MAKHKIDIRGDIIPNDYKWFYDWLEMDSTCTRDVSEVLDKMVAGDDVDVYINSPGGVIDVGSEIYTLLRQKAETNPVNIYITGQACSAASIIACASHCAMSPTALMMVHCVSSGIRGNHNDMEHMAEVLRTADRALCTAYTAKTGMTEDEALEMMENETWLTAEQAKERGLVDEIIFESKEGEVLPLVASIGGLFMLPTEEQMAKAREMMKAGIEPEPENTAEAMKQARRMEAKKLARSERFLRR